MKAMSGRRYKYDLSDIVGILWTHEKRGDAIGKDAIECAITKLYGSQPLPEASMRLLGALYTADVDYARIYDETRIREREAKELLLDVQEHQPGLINGDNIDEVISEAIRKRDGGKPST